MIEMKCPRCGTRLRFDDDAAGTTVTCTICTIPIDLPAPEAPGAPEAPPPTAEAAPAAPPVEETFHVPDYAPADAFDLDDGAQAVAALRGEPTSPDMEERRLLTVRPSFWAGQFLGRLVPLVCLVLVWAAIASFAGGEPGMGAFFVYLGLVCLGLIIGWAVYCATRRLIVTTHRTILETGRGANKRTIEVLNADIVYVNADHQRGRWGKEDRGTLTVATKTLKLKIGPTNRLAYAAAAIRGAADRARARE